MRNLYKMLQKAQGQHLLPAVVAYNRIDGPGSSLDLREFQQAFWSIPDSHGDSAADPAMKWTSGLPRTVSFAINTGTRIHAEPFEPDRIAVRSVDYGTMVAAAPGHVLPIKENWLLKIVELFRLNGVLFVLKNLYSGTHSSGLGGSATATTGVCILANELAGRPLSLAQLIAMASRLEQDYGVSITGTQEQSNVAYGGVRDYVWFPWGIPGAPDSGYGSSVRSELLPPSEYSLIEARMAIYHSGVRRASTDVNAEWLRALSQEVGYSLHRQKLEIAYRFREAIRLHHWESAKGSIIEYRDVRQRLSSAYLEGNTDIQMVAEKHGSATFPLGAGGGGAVLVFSPSPESLTSFRTEASRIFDEIPFRIKHCGHELVNIPLEME